MVLFRTPSPHRAVQPLQGPKWYFGAASSDSISSSSEQGFWALGFSSGTQRESSTTEERPEPVTCSQNTLRNMIPGHWPASPASSPEPSMVSSSVELLGPPPSPTAVQLDHSPALHFGWKDSSHKSNLSSFVQQMKIWLFDHVQKPKAIRLDLYRDFNSLS